LGGRRGVVARISPENLLEVGVGTRLTLFNYPDATKIYGTDLSEAMLERARQKARRLSEKDISLLSMDGEEMHFSDNSFDCVTIPYVWSVTPEPDKLMAALRRACKPGGVIFILNHFSGSRFWWLLERLVSSAATKIGFRSDFEFHEHIPTNDWQVEAVYPVNILGLSNLVHIRNV
jgi:phosphatidylethanolamine/phosphatidyl-N-methylethanolamine N-methyltransferase